MSCGLVIVRKELNGEEFSNTYGIMLSDDAVPLTEADLTAMVDTGTLGADQTVAVSPKLINAIVDFEMELMFQSVNFINVYVTDGRNTNAGGDPTTIFYSKNLSIHGNRTLSDETLMVPGNVTLMANRVPGGFSARQGRAYFRGCLVDANVSYKGPKLVGWKDAIERTAILGVFNDALTASGLVNHLAGGSAVAGGTLAIPHYQPESDPPVLTDGNIIGATPIVQFAAVRPVGRQVSRGRKER
jgi:hypothetical protein